MIMMSQFVLFYSVIFILASFCVVNGRFVGNNKGEFQLKVKVYKAREDPSKEAPVPMGTVYFFTTEGSSIIKVIGKISGLTPGEHGFHIHEKGDLAKKCMAAGSHYNPWNKTHGGPMDSNRHAGDMGNILADSKGVADINVILEGVNFDDLINRTLVVHEKPDDMGRGGNDESKKTGNAGKRMGCGIIARRTKAPK